MNRITLKKTLLSFLVALQLTNGFTNQNIAQVYAYEDESNDEILFNENGKKLLLIAITYKGYTHVTLGYKFSKDNAVWFKDAMDGRTYNMNKISDFIHYPELVYTEIEEVLPEELKNNTSLTREQAEDIINRFRVVDALTKLPNANDEYFDYIYQTFAADGFDNEGLHIANSSLFTDPYDAFNSFTVEDDFNEKKELIDRSKNYYKLGICEYLGVYDCYGTIYDEEAFKRDYKGGLITRYYVFDENGNYVKSLYTQEQIDRFINENQDKLDTFIWRAAFSHGENQEEILNSIENNRVVPNGETTYFISYNPKSRSLVTK